MGWDGIRTHIYWFKKTVALQFEPLLSHRLCLSIATLLTELPKPLYFFSRVLKVGIVANFATLYGKKVLKHRTDLFSLLQTKPKFATV